MHCIIWMCLGVLLILNSRKVVFYDRATRMIRVEGNLITKHDGKKEVKTADGGVWRRAAQITYVHITKDENGLEQLEAQRKHTRKARKP